MSRFSWLFLVLTSPLFAQNETAQEFYLDAHFYYGSLLRHNKNVAHLVTEQPQGFLFGFNKRTFGEKFWQQAYDYPDWGASFLHQDYGNEVLGKTFGLYVHYNFYFLNRALQFRIAQGLAINTNPFDIDTNFKNVAHGSSLLTSNFFLINYKKEHLIDGLGIQAGLTLVHHSNGSLKAPNAGTNVVAMNLGLLYDFQTGENKELVKDKDAVDFSEHVRYNFVLRGGMNEGDIIGLGQQPFLVLTAFADKRLGYKSTLQFGAEFFVSKFLEKEIEYRSIAFSSSTLTGDEDFKRASVFVGHEFRLGQVAIPTQLGYYFYWPYEYETRVYSRAGLKYYFSEKLFGVATVKSHAANAEAIEFGIGIRL